MKESKREGAKNTASKAEEKHSYNIQSQHVPTVRLL